MGVCVIERFFCTGVGNTHQKGLRMRDIVGNYSYVRNSYKPVLQSVGILHEEVTDVTFERPTYHETKPFQFPNPNPNPNPNPTLNLTLTLTLP
jgi:hypothetical protein